LYAARASGEDPRGELVSPGTVVSTDRLSQVLWGAVEPRAAINGLRAYVSRLRAVLGEDRLLHVPPRVPAHGR
jgi:DNA-binding SARP family transcriptional activator